MHAGPAKLSTVDLGWRARRFSYLLLHVRGMQLRVALVVGGLFAWIGWLRGRWDATTVGLAAVASLAAMLIGALRRPAADTTGIPGTVGPIDTEHLRLRAYRPGELAELRATIDPFLVEKQGLTDAVLDRTFDPTRTELFGRPQEWIVTGVDGRILGAVDARKGDVASTVDVTWWLGPDGRDRGFEGELLRAVTDALHRAGHRSVRVRVGPDSHAARAALEAIGARSGQITRRRLPDGREVELVRWEHVG